MTFIYQVLVGLLVMGLLDIPMITYAISPLLKNYAPELVAKRPDVAAAVVFYVGYIVLVVYLTSRFAGSTKEAAQIGALLGLLAYGTYEFTNKAVVAGWPWQMVALDTTWGVVLTTAVATVTYYVGDRLG